MTMLVRGGYKWLLAGGLVLALLVPAVAQVATTQPRQTPRVQETARTRQAARDAAREAARARAQVQPVPIPEFKQWETNMVHWGKRHVDRRNVPFSETEVWYYDGQRVFYQIADYTRDRAWIAAAHNARAVYRAYLARQRADGWRVFPHGLAMDWERHKDQESRQAVIRLARQSAFAATGGGPHESLSRETAYMINAYLAAERIGEPRHPRLEQSVEWALGHIDQWVNGQSPNWAPFMFGLTCEALIDYFHHVNADPRILDKIMQGCEVVWQQAWIERDQSLWYRANDRRRGAPDLNLLVAPAFSWLYMMTGDPKWRERGDKLFAGGVRGASLSGGKQFSQNYRWSFMYVEWRRKVETEGPVLRPR